MTFKKAIFLVIVLSVTIEALKVTHEQCNCANCCPNGMILETATLRCICPTITPYLDATGKCIPCDAPKSWNPTTRQCLDCGNGVYDKISGKCITCPPTYILTPVIATPTSNSSYQCACPDNAPYISATNTCVSCANGVWDNITKKCGGCDPSQIYDTTTKKCLCPNGTLLNYLNKCVTCPAPGVWDPVKLGCMVCPNSFFYNIPTSSCSCPTDRPYISADNLCVACKTPGIWDTKTSRCITCVGNQIYNSVTRSCECPSGIPLFDGTKCIAQCSGDTPLWNGKSCVSCPPGTNYEAGTNTCFSCPAGTVYRKDHNPCCAPA